VTTGVAPAVRGRAWSEGGKGVEGYILGGGGVYRKGNRGPNQSAGEGERRKPAANPLKESPKRKTEKAKGSHPGKKYARQAPAGVGPAEGGEGAKSTCK